MSRYKKLMAEEAKKAESVITSVEEQTEEVSTLTNTAFSTYKNSSGDWFLVSVDYNPVTKASGKVTEQKCLNYEDAQQQFKIAVGKSLLFS